MNTKKNIVIFTNIFPNPDNINKGVFIKQLTDSLTHYYNITVISPVAVNPVTYFKSLFKINSYKGSKVVNDNYTVYYPRYLIIPKIFRSFHWLSILLSTYPLVKKLHKKNKINLISSHWIYPDSSAAVIISKILNIKVSVHALGCDINNYTKFMLRRAIIIKTLKSADLIVTKSADLKRVIVNDLHISNNVSVILNGVNKDIFKPSNREECRNNLGISNDVNMLLFVGNFQIEKGLSYLLDAFYISLKKNEKLKLYIIGGGELETQILNKISSLNIASNVVVLGSVKHSLLSSYFSAADYLCLPSLREGCPNVLIESLSCGTPVIASKVGGVPDIVTSDKLGFMHEAKNVEQMSNIITSAFKDKRIHSVQNFKWYSWDDNRDLVFNEFEKI